MGAKAVADSMWRGVICIVLVMLCWPVAANTLRMAVPVPPGTLDPRRATDAVSSRLCRLLYVRLTEFDENYIPQPSLASWQKLQPLHYRFHLGSEGRQFHDGSRLDAEDVVATYESVLDKANASPFRGSLRMIESVTAIDEDTVDFVLRESDQLFPGRLTLGILPSAAANADAPTSASPVSDSFANPVGSGPFAFVARKADGSVALRRLKDDLEVVIMPVRDPIIRMLKVARAEVDMAQGDLPLALLPWLRQRDNLLVQSIPGDVFSYIGFNLQDPALADLRVRQALVHAIDRASVVRYMFHGTAAVADTVLPPWHWAAADGIEPYPHNPQLARELLLEAGFDQERPLRLQYKTSTDPFRIRLATVYQQQLAEVGVELEVRPLDWGIFYGDIKQGRFQVYGLSWVGVKLPDIFRYAYHSSSVPPHGANRGSYADSVTDSLVEQAQQEPLAAAKQLYKELQRRLHQQLPFMPLWHESQVLVRQRNVEGYQLHRDGRYDSLAMVTLRQ